MINISVTNVNPEIKPLLVKLQEESSKMYAGYYRLYRIPGAKNILDEAENYTFHADSKEHDRIMKESSKYDDA